MNAIGITVLPKELANLVNTGLEVLAQLDKNMQTAATITLAEYSVLETILTENKGDPLCMSDLAMRLRCQKSNMTQLIDRMQKRKLVKRVPHFTNQRMLMVHVEPAGYEAHAIVKEIWAGVMYLAQNTAALRGWKVEV